MVVVGGIAEMFLVSKKAENIYLRQRKGFVRVRNMNLLFHPFCINVKLCEMNQFLDMKYECPKFFRSKVFVLSFF